MTDALVLACLILTAVAMALSLAHALEYPGKKRLSRDAYLAVQPIYYPGFTWAGAAEPFAIVALAVLLAATPSGTSAFWLTAGALAAALATHGLYWLITAPVNRLWLKDQELSGAARQFFGTASAGSGVALEDWRRARDRWERSHLWRAVTAGTAFLLTALRAVG